MPRWRFWNQDTKQSETTTAPAAQAPLVAPRARGFHPPPPRHSTPPTENGAAVSAQQERLQQRREAILFDVEQAESASSPDNPWRQRIALIDEALETIARDRAALAAIPAKPGLPVPPVPITRIDVTGETPAGVTFEIGGELFHYDEDVDWAERGTQVVRPELVLRTGDPRALVPKSFPADRSDELVEHLTASLFVFATDLRDRVLNEQPLSSAPTLADLARPCDACGGWQDWHGTCAECQRRNWRRQELDGEYERLVREREREEDERVRAADRLPIARRRLAEVDAEIAAAGG